MTRIPRGWLALALPVLVAACGTNDRPTGGAVTEAHEQQAASQPASAPADAIVPRAPKTGIAACDDYLLAYRRCVRRSLRGPEATAHAARLLREQQRVLSAAASGASLADNEASCKQAFEALPKVCVH